MDPLAGWTVAVTAERRAADQAELLQGRGAEVLLAPVVQATGADDDDLRPVTEAFVTHPVDLVVVTTGIGLRSWVARAWTWGLGEQLVAAFQGAEVVARGTKAAGALVSEDIAVRWRAPSEQLDEVLEHLLAEGVGGRRVGVQLHGGDMAWFTGALRQAGAEVMEAPVYRVDPSPAAPVPRLGQAVAAGTVDAITFTSPAAVAAVAADGALVAAMGEAGVVSACVGPVTAAAATAAGIADVVTARPHRLGSMVRALAERMEARGRSLDLAGVAVRHQGSRLAVDGREVRLTPKERRLLTAMLGSGGAVLSKQALAAAAWEGAVDAHTVEVTVNRLRAKLGPAAAALETTNRRGYRIAV